MCKNEIRNLLTKIVETKGNSFGCGRKPPFRVEIILSFIDSHRGHNPDRCILGEVCIVHFSCICVRFRCCFVYKVKKNCERRNQQVVRSTRLSTYGHLNVLFLCDFTEIKQVSGATAVFAEAPDYGSRPSRPLVRGDADEHWP